MEKNNQTLRVSLHRWADDVAPTGVVFDLRERDNNGITWAARIVVPAEAFAGRELAADLIDDVINVVLPDKLIAARLRLAARLRRT